LDLLDGHALLVLAQLLEPPADVGDTPTALGGEAHLLVVAEDELVGGGKGLALHAVLVERQREVGRVTSVGRPGDQEQRTEIATVRHSSQLA